MNKATAIARVYDLDRHVAMSVLAAMVAGDPPPVQEYGLVVVKGAGQSDMLTSDGREIVHIDGIPYALRPDIHTHRRTEAIEATRRRTEGQREAQSVPPTTCTALIDGQLCGGSLSASPVCPKCALGKQGVAQIMTCEICGAQTAVMR